MKKNLIYLCFLLAFNFINAQIQLIDSADYTQRKKAKEIFNNRYEKYIESLKNQYSGKVRKELINGVEDFQKDFTEEINDKNFYFDDEFLSKTQEIVDKLREKNNKIPEDLNILISKNPSLNAYCLIDGTFVVNIGLFYFLNNEDQLAGVIAHELAHKILNHSEKSLVKSISDQYSKDSKEQISNLRSSKYNKSQKAFDLFKSKIYEKGKIKRQHEIQADSLGFLILKDSDYNKYDFVETLKLMERYDTLKPKGLSDSIYQKVFDLPNQKYNPSWINEEDFSSYDYSMFNKKLDEDSLASHPEVQERIKLIQTFFPDLKENSKTIPTSDEFTKLQKRAKLQQIPGLYDLEEYGYATYLCLLRIEKNEDVEFYKDWLGKCFDKIYTARKEYKLNRYLDRVNPKEQSKSYIRFLNFMWNLNLDEIKNIRDFYTKKS
ncbi:MAG: M48 family metalloprotease [Flavobacteriales bacterium]|nr:M48 family metalloprotease [Flavobacteriales bacterium]